MTPRLREADRIIVELERGHAGEPWHGPSRASILADVTPEEAAHVPAGGTHSIWELVLHMRAWTREVARRVREGDRAVPVEGDFPPVGATTPEAWRDALSALDAAHAEVREAITAMDAARLDDEVHGGDGDTIRETLHGLAQHDAYHSGQIMVLKKLHRSAR